jgi:hypothetical protein
MFGQTAEERLNVRSRALDDELDAAVIEVANGARKGAAAGEIDTGGPETDALDAAGEEDGATFVGHGSGDYSEGGRGLPIAEGEAIVFAVDTGPLATGNKAGWFGDCSANGGFSWRRWL